MHHCLTIEEILSAIIAYAGYAENRGVKLSSRYETDFDTLRSLAMTCKTFHAPALDRLWYTQWGLETLAALLPVDYMDMGRTLRPDEWDRFDEYARRIRCLKVTTDFWVVPTYSFGVFPSRAVLEIFRNRGKILLPRLKILRWDSDAIPSDLFHSFDIFLGPSVIDLDLRTIPISIHWFHAEPTAAEGKLDLTRLPSLCPALEKFKIYMVGTQRLISQLRTTVASLRHLRMFNCSLNNTPFPFDLLLALSTLPMLEDLSLDVHSRSEDGDLPLVESKRYGNNTILTFPALDHLQLTGDSTASCTKMLRLANLPTMRTLLMESSSMMSLHDALVAVNTHCSPTAFQELIVADEDNGYYYTEPFFVKVDGLRLLQKFKNLTSLIIACPFELTDGDMENIAAWWPQLTELQFPEIKPQVTMNGVLALVTGCPRLQYFWLVFHALQPADFDPKGCRNERVRSFGVSGSPVEGKYQAVADRLAAVFPALETISVSPYDTMPLRAEWSTVQCCLPNCAF